MNQELLHEIERQLGIIDLVIFSIIILYFTVKFSFILGRNFKEWFLDFFFTKERVIIIGSDSVAKSFYQDSLNSGYKVVFLNTKEKKKNWFSNFKLKNQNIYHIGNKINDSLLKKIRLNKTSKCLILTENDDKNVQLSQRILNFVNKKNNIKLYVSIKDRSLLEIISNQPPNNNSFNEVYYFNLNNFYAESIYDNYQPINYVNNHTTKNKEFSIAIVGSNLLSELFLAQNLLLSHHNSGLLNVYCIFKDAEKFISKFKINYPNSNKLINLISIEYLSPTFNPELNWDSKLINNLESIDVVYFFEEDNLSSVNSSLRFKQLFFNKTNLIKEPKCIVNIMQKDSILNSLDNKKNSLLDKYKQLLSIDIIKVHNSFNSFNKITHSENKIIHKALLLNYLHFIIFDLDDKLKKESNKQNNSQFIKEIENTLLNLKINDSEFIISSENIILNKIESYTRDSEYKIKKIYSFQEIWLTKTLKEKKQFIDYIRHFEIKRSILKRKNITDFSKITQSDIKLLHELDIQLDFANLVYSGFVKADTKNIDKKLELLLFSYLKIKSNNESKNSKIKYNRFINGRTLLNNIFDKIDKLKN